MESAIEKEAKRQIHTVLAIIIFPCRRGLADSDSPVTTESNKILKSDFDQQPIGGHVYSFETQNGTEQSKSADPKTVNDEKNKPHEVVVVHGSYSWTDSEGKLHAVSYVADENGFQPQSDDIPKAPHRPNYVDVSTQIVP